ncbi:hypothetical protein GWI33_018129 [Rhynchophorus ferrugineus]|uniref:Carboxypeptidase Q n=1 Tax=Rhynchophorus ferrugineus TaxID=354439 RepID=A0A834HVG6_RHYFE|nr:hypothetical protein GWI33_018129 [Rhynchophorus ferrugineus]
MNQPFLYLYLVILCSIVYCTDGCNLSQDVIKDIQSYQPIVNNIIDLVTKGNLKGKLYKDLALFVDKFGSRLTGTKNLENSIDYLLELMKSYEIDNVHGENVVVTRWRRLEEYGELLEPRRDTLPVMALGSSIGTSNDGLEAEAIVVRSFDELNQKNISEAAIGRIVVFNEEWTNYDDVYAYRSQGATEASKKGQQTYRDNVTKIPAATISKENAQMLQRIQDRGETIKIRLNIKTETLENGTSRNTVGELVGREDPEHVVAITAHTDSWDAGVGAMDDGGGAFMSIYSLIILRHLGLQPRRTLRTILFTGEEQCYCGVNDYDAVHREELKKFIFVMESDEGLWNPLGLNYTAGEKGGCILKEILQLLKPLNATRADYVENVGSDISLWTKSRIPGASLMNENGRWFWFQHTDADTMDVMDSDQMDRAVAVWTSVAYVIADMELEFPNEFQ